MRTQLVVFLGLVALAAASNPKSENAELSQLKKLLLRALEKKVNEGHNAPQQQNNEPKNPYVTINQGPSEGNPATQKEDEARPAHPRPAPTPMPITEVDYESNPAPAKAPEAPKAAQSKPEEKPAEASPIIPSLIKKPANATLKPSNSTHKPANATAHKPSNSTTKPANAAHGPANAAHKPANVVPQNPAVLLPPHIGQGPSETKPGMGSKSDEDMSSESDENMGSDSDEEILAHPSDVVIMPEDMDEFLPAAPQRHEALSLPISVMAFMMSSDVMKAAPLGTTELAAGIQNFDVILRHVIRTLRHVAGDVRKAPSLAASTNLMEKDMQEMVRVFIPAQRRASAAFFRVMVYGLEERLVCDLASEDATDCVAGRINALARLFTDPEHMDADINKIERCDDFVSNMGGGKHAVADDIECIADGVSTVIDYLRKMKDTVSEIQLAGLLDGRPLPKYHMDLGDVEHEVADELQEQFKAIMSLVFRLMNDASNMGQAMEH